MLKTERLATAGASGSQTGSRRIAQTEDVSAAAIVRRLIRAEAERRHIWLDRPATLNAIAGARRRSWAGRLKICRAGRVRR